MPLPDFIIIGAMKAGTTTLHSSLDSHPQIGMSKYKEPNFFNKYYNKGKDWYSNQFPDNKKIYGEATPAYSWMDKFPEVAGRISETLPDAKIIYILRDPIDRLISHVHHELYRDRLKKDNLDEQVLNDAHFVTTSKYYQQIIHYMQFFKKENILFLEMGELKNRPNETLNEICAFLGVDNFDFSGKTEAQNVTSKKYLIKGFDFAHNYLPRPAIKLYHYVFYFLNIKIEKPVLKKGTLKKIKEQLKTDVEKLKELTNKEFQGWKTYNSL